MKCQEQSRSISDHDFFLAKCRMKQCIILDEIKNFRFVNSIDSDNSSLTEAAFRDSMKFKLNKVHELLEKYEQFESLFPSYASLQKIYPSVKEVRDRIFLLYMWYNMTIALYSRIREVNFISIFSNGPFYFSSAKTILGWSLHSFFKVIFIFNRKALS